MAVKAFAARATNGARDAAPRRHRGMLSVAWAAGTAVGVTGGGRIADPEALGLDARTAGLGTAALIARRRAPLLVLVAAATGVRLLSERSAVGTPRAAPTLLHRTARWPRQASAARGQGK